MAFDATFWVAVSFIIFFGVLIYFKIPQNVNNLLGKMIVDIKNEFDESEKLRTESKKLLDSVQSKLNSVSVETKKKVKSITEKFKYGFTTDVESDKAPKGLNEDIVRLISQ